MDHSSLSPLVLVLSSSSATILAHQFLIQKGSVFSDRPRNFAVRNISSATYGPTWRLLRRNLASKILHPSRVKSYSWARKSVLHFLIAVSKNIRRLPIKVIDPFHYAMFCLLLLMCFGEKLDEDRISKNTTVQRRSLLFVGSGLFNVLGIFPRVAGKTLFRNRWKEFLQMRKDHEEVLIPLIKSPTESVTNPEEKPDQTVAYVDTLVNLQLPEEDAYNEKSGKLTLQEMVSMRSEFLDAGTDTTSSSLQWIMANHLKHPDIQSKLYDEIVAVVGPPPPPG